MKKLISARVARWEPVLIGSLIAIGILRVVATYDDVSQTYDEAIHIAAGLEWFTGSYTFQRENPPLARILLAAGPYLAGARWLSPEGLDRTATSAEFDYYVADVPRQAALMLGSGERYRRNLTLARLGTLMFFVATALVVWFWTRRDFGALAGLVAAFCATTLPPVLAHAGLATTDMALAATLTLGFYSLRTWLEEPSRARSVRLGLAVALALLAKFSAAVFLVAGVFAALLLFGTMHWSWRLARTERAWRYAGGMALALVVGLATVLIVYRFAPLRMLEGLEILAGHHSEGHPAYLLGETRMGGWWYFFPVALLIKTPLPFMAVAVLGLVEATRRAVRSRKWVAAMPVAFAAAIVLAVLPAKINIGVRHVLVVFPLLSIVAGYGVIRLWEWAARRRLALVALGTLAVWYIAVSSLAHPDYLAYFNEMVGDQPERFLVDSDLDWGQDVGRLAEELRSRGIEEVSLALFTSVDLTNFDLPRYRLLPPGQLASGWIAVSLYRLKVGPRGYSWLEARDPVTTVGHSIRLYHIPSSGG